MSKFLILKNPPETLEKGEFVIHEPNFMPEIVATRQKRPKSNLLTVNYLREVIAAVGLKYIGEDFDVLRSVNVSKYVGIPCDTEEQIHEVLIKAFDSQCPEILRAVVHYQFKQRPSRTNLIYYTGNPRYSIQLVELGLEQVSQKDFDDLKSGKAKKIVGKPAITAEKAAKLNTP